MQRKHFVIFLILLILLLATQSIYAQSESIQNGGFETGNHDPWVYSAGLGAWINPNAATNSVAHSGEYSLDIGCGLTPCEIQQLLIPSVFATGPLSFWIFVPLDLCEYLGDDCSLDFDLTVQYSGLQEFYDLSSQLTGSGWKKIDIPVSHSDEIQEIIFSVYGTEYLYLDDVSLLGEPYLIDCDVPGDFSTIQAAVDSTCETIYLTAASYKENITVNRTLAIQGQRAAGTVVDGNNTDSVFIVEPNGVLTLSGMTIQGGEAAGAYGRGGGIQNFGDLTLNNVTVTGNQAFNGGGIANDEGSLVINNSTIHHNSTTGNSGAGISSSGPLTITNTTISDNWTTGEDRVAGGIGIYAGTATLINCTIANNEATGLAGGIFATSATPHDPDPVVYVMNTIIADNISASGSTDCYGTLHSLDYNLIENTDGCSIIGATSHNILNKDPSFGPLQNNGGETWTHALKTGSPAIDAGSCPETTFDQRGFLRPVDFLRFPNADDGCDIGALEVQSLPLGLSWLLLLLD